MGSVEHDKMTAKPATPLPWFSMVDNVFAGDARDMKTTRFVADIQGPLEQRLKDATYIAHAANAYPKLVEALPQAIHALRASLRGVPVRNADEIIVGAENLLLSLGESV